MTVSIVPSTGFVTARYAASLAPRKARASVGASSRSAFADDLGEAAQDLREDDAGVPARAHQRGARQLVRERREIVRLRGVQLLDRGADGQREVRPGVAVGDRIDVEVVDAPAVALEREQRTARKLARSIDVGHAVN